MIQLRSILDVADNTGARKAALIQRMGQQTPYAHIGDVVTVHIKESTTDATVAPKGMENLFVLVPVPAGLTHNAQQLEKFADQILQTMEKALHLPDLRQHLVYKRLFGSRDFASQFNAHQGNALGLAHTLKQSAAWRPRNQSRKVHGLYYVGANVHPGIGLPTSLISAELLMKRLTKSP